jgi:hypothetical protein
MNILTILLKTAVIEAIKIPLTNMTTVVFMVTRLMSSQSHNFVCLP